MVLLWQRWFPSIAYFMLIIHMLWSDRHAANSLGQMVCLSCWILMTRRTLLRWTGVDSKFTPCFLDCNQLSVNYPPQSNWEPFLDQLLPGRNTSHRAETRPGASYQGIASLHSVLVCMKCLRPDPVSDLTVGLGHAEQYLLSQFFQFLNILTSTTHHCVTIWWVERNALKIVLHERSLKLKMFSCKAIILGIRLSKVMMQSASLIRNQED